MRALSANVLRHHFLRNGTRLTLAVGLALSALCLPTAARGQGPKLTILKQVWDPARPGNVQTQNAFEQADLLTSGIQREWAKARPTFEKKAKDKLGKGNLIARQITLTVNKCNMAETGQHQVQLKDGEVIFVFALKRNYLNITSTVPDPLTSDFNPTFEVRFDATMTFKLPIPTQLELLQVTKATLNVTNVEVDSQGLVADVLLVVKDFLESVSGSNLLQDVLKITLYDKTFDFTKEVNKYLEGANQVLRDAPGAGFQGFESRVDTRTKSVTMKLTKSSAAPTSGPGSITGTVRWKKSYGTPKIAKISAPGASVSFGDALAISASVQTAATGSQDFTGPARNVGKVEYQVAQVGDFHEVYYTIRNLPLAVPIAVVVEPKKGYQWVAGTDRLSTNANRSFRASGWSGKITLKAPGAAPKLQLSAPSNKAFSKVPAPAAKALAKSPGSLLTTGNYGRLPAGINPTGILSVRNIDFEMYLQEPPR